MPRGRLRLPPSTCICVLCETSQRRWYANPFPWPTAMMHVLCSILYCTEEYRHLQERPRGQVRQRPPMFWQRSTWEAKRQSHCRDSMRPWHLLPRQCLKEFMTVQRWRRIS